MLSISQSRIFSVDPAIRTRHEPQRQDEPISHISTSKRRGRALSNAETEGGRKKRKTKGKRRARQASDDEEVLAISSGESDHSIIEVEPSNQPTNTIRRSPRKHKRLVAGGYRHLQGSDESDDVEDLQDDSEPGDETVINVKDEPIDVDMLGSTEDSDADADSQSRQRAEFDAMDLQSEETEIKHKPVMKIGYSNFVICGRCLCVVVEPWPSLPRSTTPSVARLRSPSLRAPSAVLSITVNDASQRASTPLFLPEPDGDVAPFDHDDGGMLAFSQVLSSRGDYRAGVAEDEDDGMDGAAFLGDADEAREA